MRQSFWIDPIDRRELLTAVLRELAAEDSSVALEGPAEVMNRLDLTEIPGAELSLAPPFKSETGGQAAAVVLPLRSTTLKPVLRLLLTDDRYLHVLESIQIQRGGEIQFLAGDNFDRECVSVGPMIPEELLQHLQKTGVIQGYETDEAARLRLGRPD